jgi:uncharacterized protein
MATQKPMWAVEIKWSDRYVDNPGELKSLLSFMEANRLKQAIVTSIEKSAIKRLDSVTLQFIPTALYAYIVGHNTLLERRQMIGL